MAPDGDHLSHEQEHYLHDTPFTPEHHGGPVHEIILEPLMAHHGHHSDDEHHHSMFDPHVGSHSHIDDDDDHPLDLYQPPDYLQYI